MPTRRDFALTLGAATLGACVRTPPPSSAPAPSTASPGSAGAEPNDALADAMTQLVRQRYGAYLTDEQMKSVREDIVGGLRASDRLRAILLPNGTEPDVVFAVHRGGGQ
ncbi:MAG TPA: hypothetical protein VJ650_01830 [Gemmatimonadaceae bacterium]|nr:hypothetical protein [Gemmatimonadaceae bacterium]